MLQLSLLASLRLALRHLQLQQLSQQPHHQRVGHQLGLHEQMASPPQCLPQEMPEPFGPERWPRPLCVAVSGQKVLKKALKKALNRLDPLTGRDQHLQHP